MQYKLCHFTFRPVYPGGPGKPGLPLNPCSINKICYCTDKTRSLCRKNTFVSTSWKVMLLSMKGGKGDVYLDIKFWIFSGFEVCLVH